MQNKNSIVLPIFMWITCALFYGYQYLLQVSPSVMGTEIMRDFGITATTLGNLAATYMYPYALMQIPAGIFLDHLGTRKMLTIAAVLVTLGCLMFGTTHIFSIAVLGRFLIGLGGAFPVIGCMYIAATQLPTKYFALSNGLLLGIGMLGAICGQAPLAMLVNSINWRNTMWLFTALGIIITIKLWAIIRDKKPLTESHSNIIAGLKHVIRCKQTWALAIYGGLMYMPIAVFGSLWGIPFLIKKLAIPNTTAGGIITMMFIGVALGTPLLGWVSDLIQRRKLIMFASCLTTLLSLGWILYIPNIGTTMASVLLFIFGFCSGGFLVSFAVLREIYTTHHTGAAIGFMNMLNMIFAAIVQPIGGLMLDLCWQGQMLDGVRFYSLANYQAALTFLPIGIILSIACLPWIKETFCKPVL